MKFHWKKSRLGIIYVPALFLLSSCSIPYYTSAGYHQFRILLSRRSIETTLKDETTPSALKEKLFITKQAREYALEVGLDPKKTFLTHATRKNIPTIWVLTAAEKFKLKPHLWNFPVVGALPYKGFFSKKDADKEKERLTKNGYDVSLRTTAAYSTLGWFNDPVMPSTLLLEELSLFNTVVHEITHTTLWIPGSISFNETMANTFGLLGTLEFYSNKITKEQGDENGSIKKALKAKEQFIKECNYSLLFQKTSHALTTLYSSDLPDSKKDEGKKQIYSELGIEPNNALFLGHFTYLDRFYLFIELFLLKKDMKSYLKALDEISLSGKVGVPYEALAKYLEIERNAISNPSQEMCIEASKIFFNTDDELTEYKTTGNDLIPHDA
jgi:predicted aminopeptidase